MQDLHMHCKFSFDSHTNPEENIKSCINNNIKIMAFTDHIDKYCQKNADDMTFDLDDYFSTINLLREKYKKDIKILTGVEIGIAYENKDIINKIIKDNPFDFIIGSIHAVEFVDVWGQRKIIEKDPINSFRKYYSYMIDSVKAIKDFSVLGHIDYIDRYINDKSLIPKYESYEDLIEKLLKELIDTNRGIEVNTAGFRNNLPHANPKDNILTKYKLMGGDIITLGSDSHTPNTCGYMIDETIKHIKDLGFNHISYFENKIEKQIKI